MVFSYKLVDLYVLFILLYGLLFFDWRLNWVLLDMLKGFGDFIV